MADCDRTSKPAMPVGLLGASEPPPSDTFNPRGRSPFLLLGDHAGNCIPQALGTLGLSEADRQRHIAWDIGIAALGQCLARRLDAVFVRQHYSRLVTDCNRHPDAADAMPEISDGSDIPGNRSLSVDDRAARIAEIHEPYHRAIAAEIGRRRENGQETLLISLHSFTPTMNGFARPWHAGVLYGGGNEAFAVRLLAWLEAAGRWTIGDNQPYAMNGTDYTVPRHCFAAGLEYAEIEVSQGELASEAGVALWCETLDAALRALVTAG
jgi:predicted N-formylglutamate amidohydrolase